MWKAYLFQVTTGQLGPQLDLEGGSWSVSLNSTESCSFEFKKNALPKLDYSLWLAPWWAGVLLTWNDVAIYAGPIIGQPYESRTAIKLDCGGIRSILARRSVTQEPDSPAVVLATGGEFSKAPPVVFEDTSLANIAKKVVQHVQRKPGGMLPIVYPVYDYAPGKQHIRTYQNYNVATVFCDDVLTKISNVQNGPDIVFRPKLMSPSNMVFEMWTGTESNHRIQQKTVPVWDTTAEEGSVAEMQMTSTGSYQTDRVYGVGAGMNEGTIIKIATNLDRITKGFPLLETSYPSQGETPEVVVAHAEGSLADNYKRLHEVQMTVRADGVYPLGTFWPGDLVHIVVKDWVALPDGVHKARLLNMNGSLSSNLNDIKLSLQIEDD